MSGAWVLIFIQISQAIPVIGMPAMNVQPIYFQTKAACDAVAVEFNDGPEPSKETPKDKRKSFGAICRQTGDAR